VGVNRDSDGLVKEARKEPGFHLNSNVIRIAFQTNNARLNRKKMGPIIVIRWERYGIVIY